MNELKELAEFVEFHLKRNVSMEPLNFQQKNEFYSTQTCHICEKPFTSEDIKHRDHCHFTGKYQGAAHQSCNLNDKNSHTIPVVFHNLSGYDSHFLIKALATSFEGSMNLLPVNKEQYIFFTKSDKDTIVNFRFIDSFRFMPSSIDKLTSYLKSSEKLIIHKHCNSEKEFNLLTRKGVFPYDYVDSWTKLDDEQLPPKEKFYSELNDEEILDSDYIHASTVWQTFHIKTLGEYSDLYLRTDDLLLADIFENFRRNCSSIYNLDPLHYYTAPGLAFDAMLKCTGVELELLTDVEMLLFIERGIRGGVAQCLNRYAKANNRFMGTEFDTSKEESYLVYYDVNNLYGAAMSQFLPFDSFEWEENFGNLHICNIPDDSFTGYILEVHIEHPIELQELHRDLTLCPDQYTPPRSNKLKLMTTLLPNERYIIHYRNLKQCLTLDMKLTKIHRVLKFRQSLWLKKYIDLNTEMRKKSDNDFEKNFFKLMNNAIFGKTMEN
ncbi:uncharacterized protein LOC107272932, partial [Cephus cinctus]|uniref:DNA-directed DNA polymerase n=1 Tax=Cephus cinctus TaxID=211228 RepID=A0AAJ7FSH8_CEPCN